MPQHSEFHAKRGQVRIYFKEWREYRGLTQQRLADRIGTTKHRVSRKERGLESWDDAYLAAMADAVDTQPASLLMRNPMVEDAPWSLIEGLSPANQAKAIEYIKLLKTSESDRAA